MKVHWLILALILASCGVSNRNDPYRLLMGVRGSTYEERNSAVVGELEHEASRYGWNLESDSAVSRLSVEIFRNREDIPLVLRLQDSLLEHLTLDNVTAYEVESIRSGQIAPILSGRVIDQFYRRHWDQVVGDSLELRRYLKKAALFDPLLERYESAAEVSIFYTDRFAPLSAETAIRLRSMRANEDDPHVRRSITVVCATHDGPNESPSNVLSEIDRFSHLTLSRMTFARDSLFYEQVADAVNATEETRELDLLMGILERGENAEKFPALIGLLDNHNDVRVEWLGGHHIGCMDSVTVRESALRELRYYVGSDVRLLYSDTLDEYRECNWCECSETWERAWSDRWRLVWDRYGNDISRLRREAYREGLRRIAFDTGTDIAALDGVALSPLLDSAGHALWLERVIDARREYRELIDRARRERKSRRGYYRYVPSPGLSTTYGLTPAQAAGILIETPEPDLPDKLIASSPDSDARDSAYLYLTRIALDSLSPEVVGPMLWNMLHPEWGLLRTLQVARVRGDTTLLAPIERILREERDRVALESAGAGETGGNQRHRYRDDLASLIRSIEILRSAHPLRTALNTPRDSNVYWNRRLLQVQGFLSSRTWEEFVNIVGHADPHDPDGLAVLEALPLNQFVVPYPFTYHGETRGGRGEYVPDDSLIGVLQHRLRSLSRGEFFLAYLADVDPTLRDDDGRPDFQRLYEHLRYPLDYSSGDGRIWSVHTEPIIDLLDLLLPDGPGDRSVMLVSDLMSESQTVMTIEDLLVLHPGRYRYTFYDHDQGWIDFLLKNGYARILRNSEM